MLKTSKVRKSKIERAKNYFELGTFARIVSDCTLRLGLSLLLGTLRTDDDEHRGFPLTAQLRMLDSSS